MFPLNYMNRKIIGRVINKIAITARTIAELGLSEKGDSDRLIFIFDQVFKDFSILL